MIEEIVRNCGLSSQSKLSRSVPPVYMDFCHLFRKSWLHYPCKKQCFLKCYCYLVFNIVKNIKLMRQYLSTRFIHPVADACRVIRFNSVTQFYHQHKEFSMVLTFYVSYFTVSCIYRYYSLSLSKLFRKKN